MGVNMASNRPLTTTSYAILGVLAIRPWPAYELTRYMRTSAVRRCWPRTESRLYAEPRNLVAHSLAVVSTEHTGRRRRTIYAITPAGRRALAKWLGERSEPREMQDETLLRILLSDHGTPGQLLATIRWGLEDLRTTIAELTKISDRIEAGDTRFPQRLHVTALASQNGIGLLRQRYDFLVWAAEWVRTWNDTRLEAEKRKVALRTLKRSRALLLELDGELGRQLGEPHGNRTG
jgi:DNA-binding PadR family transcriptional regulator